MSSVLETKLTNAKDLAHKFLSEEITEARIGEYLGFVSEGENVLTHKYKCVDKAYVGWYWAVTLALSDEKSDATVSEIVLLPGQDAIKAKAWIPWEQRVQPGDIGVGDVLPTAPDDLRLVPGFTGVEDLFEETLTPQGWEIGLGRKRVLSVLGKDQTAERWHEGIHGPRSPISEPISETCSSCGFYVSISGSLGQVFGVCTNKFSVEDGKVVSLDHGCGGHSEIVANLHSIPTGQTVLDDDNLDTLEETDSDKVTEELAETEEEIEDIDVDDLENSRDLLDETELEESQEN